MAAAAFEQLRTQARVEPVSLLLREGSELRGKQDLPTLEKLRPLPTGCPCLGVGDKAGRNLPLTFLPGLFAAGPLDGFPGALCPVSPVRPAWSLGSKGAWFAWLW